MVTYPAQPATETSPAVEARTEEFVDVMHARAAAAKVPGATYDRKSARAV